MFQPRNYWEASFPFRGPEKNTSLEPNTGIFALGGHVWVPKTWTKNFKKEFLTPL